MLSRRNYAKDNANPKRSAAAQDGALKRTRNEERIWQLRLLLRDVQEHLETRQQEGADLLERVRKEAA